MLFSFKKSDFNWIISKVLAYLPEYIPFDRLGYFGKFSKYMISEHKLLVILIFWAMWSTHFCEAIYVVRVAHSLNLSKRCLNRWFFQTLLIGYPSTRLMLNYAEKERKKNWKTLLSIINQWKLSFKQWFRYLYICEENFYFLKIRN